jgi:hypothetical protein
MEDDPKRNVLLWGAALAWAPWVPMLIGLSNVFVGINNSKATGLAAVTGGFVEAYFMVGLAATVICELAALVLLFRASKRSKQSGSALRVLSICASAFMMALFCLSIWLIWFVRHHGY